MRQDEDAERSCRVHEPGRRDGLARSRGMSEAVAPGGSRIGVVRLLVELTVLDEAGVEVVFGLLLELDVRDGPVPAPVVGAESVLVRGPLRRRDELRQHARQRVDLMPPKLRACCRANRVRREDALEAEHEPVLHLPARGGLLEPGLHLRQGVVEGGTSRCARCERRLRIFVRMEEGLAEPGSGASGRFDQFVSCFRRQRRHEFCFVHACSTACCRSFRRVSARSVRASVTPGAYLRLRPTNARSRAIRR